jgi:hypothetical protein
VICSSGESAACFRRTISGENYLIVLTQAASLDDQTTNHPGVHPS